MNNQSEIPVIGELTRAELYETACNIPTLATIVPNGGYEELSEYPITGDVDIAATTHARAEAQGAILMSSGGTTGAPKLSWLPYDLGLERQCQEWNPLDASSVLLNLFNPGRLWGSHYYMQELARISRSVVLPTGPFEQSEIPNWIEIFLRAGVNTLAGNPTTLADFAESCLVHKLNLPIRKIIWMAEPWTPQKLESIAMAFPETSLWGNYGAVETWVMGTSTQKCTPNVLHLLPEHIVECHDSGALISRKSNGWAIPLLRYNLGDRVVPSQCKCGRGRAIRVLGRIGDTVSLRSAIFRAEEILEIVRSVSGVSDAQIVLSGKTEKNTSASSITICFTTFYESRHAQLLGETVRRQLVTSFVHMASILTKYPDALHVKCVDNLIRVDRTNKTPMIIHR